MTAKHKISLILIVFLFLSGNLMAFIGLSKGKDIAISMTKPIDQNTWTTSGEAIIGYTYIPIIIGVSFIILSLIFSTVLFINWIKHTN